MFDNLFAKRGLSFDRLRVLLEVGEAGSIAKAADGDPVRQSQYSRQIKELEEFFGVELTARRGRLLKLTHAGEELAGLVREQMMSLGDFSQRMVDEPSAYTLGAGESLIHWLVIPRLKPATTALPKVSLRLCNLRSAEIVERLEDRTLDFGLLRDENLTPAFERTRLGVTGYVLAVPPPLWAAAENKKDDLRILAQFPLATLGNETDFGMRFFDLMKKIGVRLDVRLECDSFPSVSRAIEAGSYAGIVPDLARSDVVLRNAKVVPLKVLAPLARSVSLTWLPRRLKVRPQAPLVQRWLAAALRT